MIPVDGARFPQSSRSRPGATGNGLAGETGAPVGRWLVTFETKFVLPLIAFTAGRGVSRMSYAGMAPLVTVDAGAGLPTVGFERSRGVLVAKAACAAGSLPVTPVRRFNAAMY